MDNVTNQRFTFKTTREKVPRKTTYCHEGILLFVFPPLKTDSFLGQGLRRYPIRAATHAVLMRGELHFIPSTLCGVTVPTAQDGSQLGPTCGRSRLHQDSPGDLDGSCPNPYFMFGIPRLLWVVSISRAATDFSTTSSKW